MAKMTARQREVLEAVRASRPIWFRARGNGERVTLASLYRRGALERRVRRGVEGDPDAAYEYAPAHRVRAQATVTAPAPDPGKVYHCKSCPWRVGTVPELDIPNGYSCDLHEGLRGTIRDGLASLPVDGALRVMACHYSPIGHEFPCAGWLEHQLGPGNNLGVRLAVMSGRLPQPVTDGPQHQTFDDTLPRRDR